MVKILDEINFYEYFGSRIKILRKKRKVTQQELAKHLEISPTALVNYENGNRKIPLDIAIKIAGFFRVSIDSIVMIHYKSLKDTDQWNNEFKETVFRPHEINELISYAKYILFKRNDN